LRKILARETGVAPEDLVIWEANHEKPRLVIPPGAQQVHFNVSHSGDYAVIAVSRDGEVGVDIEQIRLAQPFLDLARRFYSARENSWLESIAPERQAEAFCRIWAVKEAVLKCAGLGLSVPTQKVEVVFATNAPPVVKCPDPDWKQLERFSVQELHLVDGYASALAVDASGIDVELVGALAL
jgi:4'-phosphopantetheinyl transferase